MKLIQKKNQNKTHFEEGSFSHTSPRDGSGYQNKWIFGKGSKQPFTLRPSEWSLSLEIMCNSHCACISYYLALVPSCIYSAISIIKKLQHYFPKMRWRQRREESIEISNSIEAALILTLCHWLFVKGMVPHDMQCPFTFEPLIHCLQLPHCDSRVKITREKNVDHRVKGWEKAPHLC